ncbi:four-carbon acid sugar kinase family protein [Nocardioides sp. BGMRC 2183]|nr:four-carbon acid sugar kinase family protein [Nocardioides sp. BGMRC 2183]
MIALGCIADDFTGGTDVAAALRRAGMSVTLLFDVPDGEIGAPSTDAVVIALKTRTIPPNVAVRHALDALGWLQKHDVDRVYFKYCSTFDSTDEGNIGPVADALLEALGESTTVVCPASPEHGRTTYLGHHFVGDRLLAESSMRDHPLTPMRESRLDVVLGTQTDGDIGLLTLPVVLAGPERASAELRQVAESGKRYVVTDATSDVDLQTIAAAASHLRLLTGGAGLAGAWGHLLDREVATPATGHQLPVGDAVVLAGSCSAATLAQVQRAREHFPAHRLDPVATPDPQELLDTARTWLRQHWGSGPVLLYSSAGPEDRSHGLAAMGARTPEVLERTLGDLAREAVALGAERVVVAGGETSGAVVQALGIDQVVVAGEADRGVPWCLTAAQPPVALLLKSGNFGSEDLLVRATKEQL